MFLLDHTYVACGERHSLYKSQSSRQEPNSICAQPYNNHIMKRELTLPDLVARIPSNHIPCGSGRKSNSTNTFFCPRSPSHPNAPPIVENHTPYSDPRTLPSTHPSPTWVREAAGEGSACILAQPPTKRLDDVLHQLSIPSSVIRQYSEA